MRHSTLILALLPLWFSCDGGSTEPVESDADTDADADSDTDADVDTDTDADADTDSDPAGFDPESAGPHGFDTTFTSDGPLPARVFRTQAAGPAPVVVLVHGFQLEPDLYGSYGARLATWGWTVVLPEHSGSNHANLAARVTDVLDWIDTEPAAVGAVDPDIRVMAGHSLGGKLVALNATTEARVDGLFLIDPVDSMPPIIGNPTDHPSVTPQLMPQITVPIVAVGETNNQGGLQPCAPADQNFEQYFDNAASPALQIDVLDASHMSFLDDPNCGFACSACPNASDDPAETRRITRAALVAFAEQVRGTDGAREWLVNTGLSDFEAVGLITVETANGF